MLRRKLRRDPHKEEDCTECHSIELYLPTSRQQPQNLLYMICSNYPYQKAAST